MNKQILDGCTAAAHVAYAMSDYATVYPITPIGAMGDTAMKWGLAGRLNLMGQKMSVREMESELGATGALHGALAAGALATTFTASQGLMLMIPNMYKIAGELLPGVFHVGCRSLATHALSIFGDHQDVMACRATGFTMLASASVQETMDLAVVAHLAAIDGSLPVLHFFDGWRTSSEMDTIDVIDYEDIRPLVNWDNVKKFRERGLNPEHPIVRGSCQDPDVYFQNTEARNSHYDAFPAIVQGAMDRLAGVTGRQYHLLDYSGAPDAEQVIVVMGSAADVVAETVEYLNSKRAMKTGVVKVRLYRPFPSDKLRKILPKTVKTVAALDRTREFGAEHEPLCMDVISALSSTGIKVIGGRYGLSSKEFNPSMVKAVFDEMAKEEPRSTFTVGINDDVTHLSIDVKEQVDTDATSNMYQAVFYGIGNDGTVGGTKQVAGVLGSREGMYAQAYFDYSAKKSGGYTISQLRIAHSPITSAYSIDDADYVACHKTSYVYRYAMADKLREGGKFVLNAPWPDDRLVDMLPLSLRQSLASKKAELYVIDADKIAAEVGLAPHINMPMETAFLYLSGIVPFKEGYDALAERIRSTYMHEGGSVVERNLKAIAMTEGAIRKIDYQGLEGWTTEPEKVVSRPRRYSSEAQKSFIEEIHIPCTDGKGDSIPVSAFSPDGSMPMGTTAFERRRIATRIPVWDVNKCVECTECSLVCPHAAIRPFLMTADELKTAPEGLTSKPARGYPALKGLNFRIQVFTDDCLGCSSCSIICQGNALTMTPVEEARPKELPLEEWVRATVAPKDTLMPAATIAGSQLQTPCLEFSGACAGCGETPYVKLLTQLFGKRLVIANATGCSSVWGVNYPSNSYCATSSGKGPAWANSLFEDNAEYGYGMLGAINHRRARVASLVSEMIEDPKTSAFVKPALEAWLSAKDDPELSAQTAERLKAVAGGMRSVSPKYAELIDSADMLASKTVWAIGGDGWAYDIGFAGLDHVLASGENVKVLVMDTECYSNTGGHASKATPRSAVALYAPDGKKVAKKDLGRMMMTYGSVYVASIALGANYQQAIDALMEAERFPGPAIVIAYCPCLVHGIRPGLGHSIVEERRAVEAGYWPLYRFDPSKEHPLIIDHAVPAPDHSGHNGSSPQVESPGYPNPEPISHVDEYINNEDRYADLRMTDPKEAGQLQPRLQLDCNEENQALKDMS